MTKRTILHIAFIVMMLITVLFVRKLNNPTLTVFAYFSLLIMALVNAVWAYKEKNP